MKRYKIAVLPGDGIGPEVMEQALFVLNTIAKRFEFEIELNEALIGGTAIDHFDDPLPPETIEICKNSDAVLLGAVGGPKWDGLSGDKRPEKGLLRIRAELELFANLRPAIVYDALKDASPLKRELLQGGLDLMVVRELTGGIYFGSRGRDGSGKELRAFDTEEYRYFEIERIACVAFESARKRKKKLCSVDKANVLESSRLWRECINEISREYPDVSLEHLYVDNAAMQLVRNPRQFDTIVTNNIFGDILSDEASQITGSIGMLPSASLGMGSLGLYEPVHGSAPDIAGKNIANPLAAILSVAMMLRYSFSETEAAELIEKAVSALLDDGYRTADLAKPGEKTIGTKEMGEQISARLG